MQNVGEKSSFLSYTERNEWLEEQHEFLYINKKSN